MHARVRVPPPNRLSTSASAPGDIYFYANNQPSNHTEQLHALLENLRSLGDTVRLGNQSNVTKGAAVSHRPVHKKLASFSTATMNLYLSDSHPAPVLDDASVDLYTALGFRA